MMHYIIINVSAAISVHNILSGILSITVCISHKARDAETKYYDSFVKLLYVRPTIGLPLSLEH